MTIEELIQQLQKESVRGSGDDTITIVTASQLLPNAHYNVEVGIDPEGRPVLVPTTLATSRD
jgi:hypothetical protein